MNYLFPVRFFIWFCLPACVTSTAKILEGTGIELKNPPIETCVTNDCHVSLNTDGSTSNSAEQPVKKILFWTSFFGKQDYEFGLGKKPFVDAGCVVSNCMTTINKSEVNTSSAVIFHMRNVNGKTEFPSFRMAEQHWVFFSLESPMHQWNDLKRFNGVFNLTITYRKDSDIKILYGKVIPSPHGPLQQNDNDFSTVKIKRKPFKEKKAIAWFVSNCKTHSKREDYVNELQKYVDVDIYGECGPLTCPEDGTRSSRRRDPECYQMLEEEYKFYLSFENAFCKDYVTEKVFNILKLNVVPVVMGATDYDRDLPPGSFINIRDYKSPKELAAYLKDLGQDEKRYKQYFKWKAKYEVQGHQAYRQGFCDLCEFLNRPYSQNQVYEDIDKWWGKDTYCNNNVIERQKNEW